MKRLLRVVISVVVLSTLAISGVLVIQYNNAVAAGEAQPNILDETVVEIGDLTVTVSATGSILPLRQVPLIFELTAPVTEVLVRTGDTVQAGDVLARLDATDFEAALADARIALEGRQLAFDALTAPPRDVDLAVAEASLEAAQASYNAAASTAPSDEEVEIARLQSELARNQLWQTQLQADPIIPLDSITLPPDLPPEVQQFIIDTINALNAQNRAQYSTALDSLEYGIDIAEANYASAQSRGPDLGSVNSAYAGIVQAEIGLERLQNGAPASEIESAQIDLQTAQLAVDQAQATLDRTVLTAPFSGIIAEMNLTVGQFPPTDQVALLLVDNSGYYVELPIDETDIVKVAVGQSVELALDALPDAQIMGKVNRVSVTPTRVGQLVTYLVRVDLDPTTAPVRMGMSATARITTEQLEGVLIVRNRFIRIDRATRQAYVTVQDAEGNFTEIPVVLGLRNETFSQIVSGVEAGQKLVLLPRETFIPGVSR
jgi:HlyD family secretion protein